MKFLLVALALLLVSCDSDHDSIHSLIRDGVLEYNVDYDSSFFSKGEFLVYLEKGERIDLDEFVFKMQSKANRKYRFEVENETIIIRRNERYVAIMYFFEVGVLYEKIVYKN